MSSVPGYSMLDMPELDTSSSDSSPSSGMSSIEQNEFLPGAHQRPVYIPPSYQTGYYGYLSPPAPYIPSWGYNQPISPGVIHVPDFSGQGHQAYHYGYNCNYPLPTIPPRFSATAPVSMPGRTTGCVSPLDLFGNMPEQRSLPTTGWSMGEGSSSLTSTPSLEIAVEMDEPDASTLSLGENDPVSPTPSLESGICFEEAEREDELEDQAELGKQQKVEVKHEVKKQKKLLPAGGKAILSATNQEKEEAMAVEGKEGKKRSRSAQACERCRIRKARCFGGHPCNRCIKRKFTCEFTPTKAKAMAKPEPTKPKIRRHSMHTVSSSVASDPSATGSGVRPAPLRAASHAHSRSITVPTSSSHPYARPLAPAPPNPAPLTDSAATALPSSHIGLGLGLMLGLQLSPPPDDLEAEDDNVPEMSTSSTTSSSHYPLSGIAPTWSSITENRASETHAPTMIVDEDIFQFPPVQAASSLTEWGSGMDFDSFESNFAESGHGGVLQQGLGMDQSSHMMYGLTDQWGGQAVMFRA